MDRTGDAAPARFRWVTVTAGFVAREWRGRDLALDALRGLMVMAMVFVNHPPPAQRVHAVFVHAEWHGWTLADTVFPGFLFAVGVAIGLSDPTRFSAMRTWRRFAVLMVLNYLLVNFPYYFHGAPHLDGTLALIAWCSLFAALAHHHLRWKGIAGLAVALLALQVAAYLLLPLSGAQPGTMTPEANAARELDAWLFKTLLHLGTVPEPVQTLPLAGAVVSTLAGVLAAQWVASSPAHGRQIAGLVSCGAALWLAGLAMGGLVPINKALWTPSYAVAMAGLATLVFAILHAVDRGAPGAPLLRALQVAGANALFFYVLAQSIQRVLVYMPVPRSDGSRSKLGAYVYTQHFAHWIPGAAGALVWTTLFLLLCYAAAWVLYRRRIMIHA